MATQCWPIQVSRSYKKQEFPLTLISPFSSSMPHQKRACSTSPNDTVRNVRTKEMAFVERYDTANKTKEQILSKFYFIHFIFLPRLDFASSTSPRLCVGLSVVDLVDCTSCRPLKYHIYDGLDFASSTSPRLCVGQDYPW